MTVLLDDVLTYGKAETSKINVTRSAILLKDFFVSIFEEVGHNTKNTHSILANLEDLPETILSDTKLLRNIFINLLTNAIKYSPGKKQLFFDVVNLPNALQISIRDEGIGIKLEDKERIFDPFTRGEGVEKIQGTGLGLSIVKRAVELLEAKIHVQSEPFVGTTFTVELAHQSEVYGEN